MTVGELKNWVWCEKCLEYKDAGEVCFIGIEEDELGTDVLHFLCDKCDPGQSDSQMVWLWL